jgi:hypothetical protein
MDHLAVQTYSLANAYKENVIDTAYFFEHYLAFFLVPLGMWLCYNVLGQTYLILRDTMHVDILGWLSYYTPRN